MLMINVGNEERSDLLTQEVMSVNAADLSIAQRATLQTAFEVYARSVIMLERTEAATSSRAWSVASMVIAAAFLVLLRVPPHIILTMVIGAEVLGVVVGKATRRAVKKAIEESQEKLREEVKCIRAISDAKSQQRRAEDKSEPCS